MKSKLMSCSSIRIKIFFLSLCFLFGFLNSSALAQNHNISNYSPSAPHIALQTGSGVVFGAVGAVTGGFIGIALTPQDSEGIFPESDYAPIGIFTGYAAGSALGIYIVANSKLYKASYGRILIGTTIGASLSFAGFASGIGSPQALILAVALPTIGGIFANYLSAEKRVNNSSALLNISNDSLTLAPPSIRIAQVENYNFPKNRSATLKLLNISL